MRIQKPKRELTVEEREGLWQRERIQEYEYWKDNIPFLTFPPDWEISVIPPFATAMIRFRVRHGTKEVSVYLDCHNTLGCMSNPYWEIYPDEHGETERYNINDTEGLINGIQFSLQRRQL